MWAGGPPQWTQWALNPNAYQGMSNDEVDWARLAQQWIMMKDTGPPGEPTGPPGVMALSLPPPPEKHHVGEEGGVADMDIGKDEDEGETQPPAEGSGFTDQWGNWQQWGGYNTWPPGAPPGSANSMLPGPGMTKNGSDSMAAPYTYSGGAAGFDYNNSRTNNYNQGYWADSNVPGPGGQAPFVRGGHFRTGQTWEGKNKRDFTQPSDEDDESEPVIDAAKRRTLPIWIREGLEKMEREKQKQLEKEQMENQREEMIKQRRLKEQEALNEIQAERGLPPKSKFDSDSEERASEDEDRIPSASSPPNFKTDPIKRKSRFHDGPLGIEMRSTSPPKLTKDELMLKVRRTMTEVLLAVTTDEIKSVVRDALMRARRKAPAKQDSPKKPMAVASLKGSLGLAMYGSGSEGSDSDSEDDRGGQQHRNNDSHSDYDSDINLKDEIRRRQQDFIAQEREIEAQAAEVEQREKQGGGRGGKEGLDHQQGTSGGDPKRQVESESAISNPDGSGDRKKRHEKDEVSNHTNNEKQIEKNDKSLMNHNKTKSDKKNKSSSDESSESSRSSKRKHKKKNKEKKKDKKDKKHKDDNSDTGTSKRSKRRDRSTSRHREDRKKRERSRSRSRRRDRSRSKESRSLRDRSDSRSRRDESESRSRRSRSPRRSRRSQSDSRSRRERSRSGSSRRHRRHKSSSYSSSGSERYRRKRSRR